MASNTNPTTTSVNLGQVSAVSIGSTVPTNKNLIWINNSGPDDAFYYWSNTAGAWKSMNPAVSAFINGGNAYGAGAILGLNDNYGLSVVTNNIVRVVINNDGSIEVKNIATFDKDIVVNTMTVGSGQNEIVTNSGIGVNVLKSITSGTDNSSCGNNALEATTTGIGNTAIGSLSGAANTTGNFNCFEGYESGTNNTTGSYNIFLGEQSGGLNTTGSQNVFIGKQAGLSIGVAQNYNVVLGGYEGSGITTSNNVFIADGQGNVRITIPASGNLLVNTTTDTIATAKLQVNGDIALLNPGNKLHIVANSGSTMNCSMGFARIALGTGAAIIANTNVTANSIIWVAYTSQLSFTGISITTSIFQVNPTAGVGFTVYAYTPGSASLNLTDGNYIQYWIIN